LDQALFYYRRALDLDGRHAQAAYNMGLILKGRGQLGAARDAFALAVQHQPNLVPAGYMLALTCRELGERGRAISQAKRTLRVKPDYAALHLLLGMLRADERHYRDARESFESALRCATDPQVAEQARLGVRRMDQILEQKKRR
jgi:tetratricopeptide (TPR) repeat protein